MTGPHAALVSILADLAADALGFALVVAGVWALVRGAGWLRAWREDRNAADRSAPDLRSFEKRRNDYFRRRLPLTRYPKMTEATRQAIIHEATDR